MASGEDVIELGSSDEDAAEPVPKKRKGPPPNAMVHIPNNLTLSSEMTIEKKRKAKPVINPASLIKGSSLTITKVQKNSQLKVNPVANTTNVNGNVSIRQQSPKPGLKRNLNIPIAKNPILASRINAVSPHLKINPASVKHVTKISPNSIPQNAKVSQLNTKVFRPQLAARKVSQSKPMSVDNVQTSTNKKPVLNSKLLPEIVITRTSPPAKKGIGKVLKAPIKPSTSMTINPPIKVVTMSRLGKLQVKSGGMKHNTDEYSSIVNSSQSSEVPTVDLDDDDPPPSGPQWYLRPEEQDRDPLAEDANNENEPANMETEESIENAKQNSTKEPQTMSESSTLEKQNNEEPEKAKYIEITIEDSPIKPLPNKKGFQVGAELPITIDDSPVRRKTKKTQSSHSDDEKDESEKEPSSKKKLDYPVTDVHVVEIEFEPIVDKETTSNSKDDEKSQEGTTNDEKKSSPSKDSDVDKQDSNCRKSDKIPTSESTAKGQENKGNKEEERTERSKSDNENAKSTMSKEDKTVPTEKTKDRNKAVECIDIVEIEESPIKPDEELAKTTPKKNNIQKPTYKISKPIEIIDLDDKDMNEFNSMYQSFIKLCLQLENSEDMKKIVEKKIKAYYRQVPKDYTDSDVFIDMVGSKIMAMKAAPEKMYLYIKDVVDELNVQRKIAKAEPVKEKNEEQEKFLYGEESEFDAKRQRQIRKLEKTLKKLHRAIQKLEEQEVDFDDEEDSVYLLTERYKERSVRVHAKLCQLTNTKMPSEARVVIDPRPGQPKGPAKRLEKWINRKVPIGTPLPFPDFHDVLRCVREANKEDDIGWNEADIMEEARDLFVRCGKKLQRRRQENEWRLAASRMPPDSTDPVEEDSELKRKLEDNRRLAAKKETEVFNKYADRQKQLMLEAVEIGDKEAEESPVESDDEVEEVIEVPDTDTDKQKRKERIKKLLQNSKVSDHKAEQKADDNKTKEQSPEKNSVKENTPKDSSEAKSLNDEDKSQKDQNEGETSEIDSKSHKKDDEVDDLKSDHEDNLLERRYSVSNKSSSDSESPIAIDTSSSDEFESKKASSDVISIENSSLSESDEKKNEGENEKEDNEKNSDLEQIDEEMEDANKSEDEIIDSSNKAAETFMDISMDDAVDNKEKEKPSSNVIEHCNGLSEEVLLASTDEEEENDKANPDPSINLRDDNISIGETMIVENREIDGSEDSKEGKSDKNTDSSSVEGMEIGPEPSETASKESELEIVTAEKECLHTETNEILETSQTDKEDFFTETTNIDSRESVKNLIDAVKTDDRSENTENANETICLSSVESVYSGNMNEIDDNTSEKMSDSGDKNDKPSVNVNDVIEDSKILEENNEASNNENEDHEKVSENCENSVLDKENLNGKESAENVQDTIHTENIKENINDSPVLETKENNNSGPSEHMQVDSQESL